MHPASENRGANPQARARATALAFITEESEHLAIHDTSDLHELGLSTREDGTTLVDYIQAIGGLQLLETQIHFEVDAAGSITRVDATLKPVPEALRRAARSKTLTQRQIVEIVERELAGRSAEPRIRPGVRKFATWRAPYVVWGIAASTGSKPPWSYTLDAFTGEVLSRSCTARAIGPSRGATPCD